MEESACIIFSMMKPSIAERLITRLLRQVIIMITLYQQYQTDKLHGRILTPDGLRLICAGLDNDPEKIGIHMLEMLAKFRNEGIVD